LIVFDREGGGNTGSQCRTRGWEDNAAARGEFRLVVMVLACRRNKLRGNGMTIVWMSDLESGKSANIGKVHGLIALSYE